MGAVYRAEHVGTGRQVAVKTILPHLVESDEALGRFRREARAAGSLRHPNVVDVTDFGIAESEGEEVAYLVMEYLEGRTLGEVLREAGSVPADLVADIVEQIALALEAAHAEGIVHRDLKPDNIWLIADPRGGYRVRVLDFGIARLRERRQPRAGSGTTSDPAALWSDSTLSTEETLVRSDPAGPDDATVPMEPEATIVRRETRESLLTTPGSTLGTPAYMSPEQCAGARIGPESDIYSLGVVVWQMLAGRPLFEGDYLELIRQHLEETAPRVDQERAGIPRRLGDAVARALEKDPRKRYPSARAMAGAVRVSTEGPGEIIRKAAILSLERPKQFLEMSWKAAGPSVVLAIASAFICWWLGTGTGTLAFAALAGMTSWGFATVRSHAFFAELIDQIRRYPLKSLESDAILERLKQRFGVAGDSRFALMTKLVSFYLQCELWGPAGQGDLAFQIAFHEDRHPRSVQERCEALSSSTKSAYDRVRLVILLTVMVIPFLLGGLVILLGIVAGAEKDTALAFAFVSAMLSLPLLSLPLNPTLSSALALLYFRARQANGEDVALAAVAPSRL